MSSIIGAITGPDKKPLYAAQHDARKRYKKVKGQTDDMAGRVQNLLDRDRGLLSRLRALIDGRGEDVAEYRQQVREENEKQRDIRRTGGQFRQLAYSDTRSAGDAQEPRPGKLPSDRAPVAVPQPADAVPVRGDADADADRQRRRTKKLTPQQLLQQRLMAGAEARRAAARDLR